jgi:hypothetical protein
LGVKPPKRGIELGWVTRGTRPKKPSSSRDFARGAREAQGGRGGKERGGRERGGRERGGRGQGREVSSSAQIGLCPRRRINGSARTHLCPRGRMVASARTRSCLRGRQRVRADAHCFTLGNFKKDATVCPSHGRPRGHRPTVRPSVRSKTSV